MIAASMHMAPVDVFWVFIMVAWLQPVLKQRLLEASSWRLIANVERSEDHA
jgi:hypothetical protein